MPFVIQYHEIVIALIALVLWRIFGPVLDFYVSRFLKKDNQNYVTVPSCEQQRVTCNSSRLSADAEFKKEMRENFATVKGILVAYVLQGTKPSTEELKELFK